MEKNINLTLIKDRKSWIIKVENTRFKWKLPILTNFTVFNQRQINIFIRILNQRHVLAKNLLSLQLEFSKLNFYGREIAIFNTVEVTFKSS